MNYNKSFITKEVPELLSKEELYELLKKYHLGDLEARNKIVEHNIGLVYMTVKKFEITPYDIEELLSVGFEALIKSVNTFDINRGFEFSTYALRVINNEILVFIRKNKKYIYNESLEQPIIYDKDGNESELMEFLEDENSDFVSECMNMVDYRIIREFINNLPDKERKIIMMYYGFINDKTYSQREIADELNMTQSGVSRTLIRVVRKLERRLLDTEIIDYREKEKSVKRKWLVR